MESGTYDYQKSTVIIWQKLRITVYWEARFESMSFAVNILACKFKIVNK